MSVCRLQFIFDQHERRPPARSGEAGEQEELFEGWADEVYDEGDEPPFLSADGENYDEDEDVTIRIVCEADEADEAARELAAEAAAVPAAPAAPAARAPSAPPSGGGAGRIGHDPSLRPVVDVGIFARHPAPAVLGGSPTPAIRFPGGTNESGFAYLVQRLSQLCYSVAAYCADPRRGARYAVKRMKNVIDKVIIFVPPDSCGRGGPHAPPPAALVDTVDTALIDPSSGNSRLTVNALRRAVGDGTTHLFLNKLDDVDGLADVLEACGEQLRVLCLVECTVGLGAMRVLAEKAAQLQGLVFQNCVVLGLGPGHPGREERLGEWDECLAELLAACPQLLWLSAGFMNAVPLGQRAWQAVPARCTRLR